MATSAEVVDRLRREAPFDGERPSRESARVERRDEVMRVELRRVDRLLQIEPAVHVSEEDVKRPLLLLVTARRPPHEPRLALPQSEARREGRARPRPRPERGRQPVLEPEHLRPRAERPAE